MIRRSAITTLLMGLICCAVLPIAATEGLRIERIAVCTSIEDRQPIAEAESFPADVGTLWCFTKVVGAEEETSVQHVWYYDGKERFRISLKVGKASWRTWSAKSIPTSWTGAWRVVVEDSNGTPLSEASFTVGS